jgi:hypothetical protein
MFPARFFPRRFWPARFWPKVGATAPGTGITLVSTVPWAPAPTGGTSAGIDTTGATLLLVSAAYYFSGSPTNTISDSKGNPWVPLTASAGGVNHQWFYVLAPVVGPGHTFTITCSGSGYPACHAYAFAGVGSYQTESGVSSAVPPPPLACGSLTPTVNGALVVAGLGYLASASTADTITPAGFTTHSILYVSGATVQGSAAWQVQAVAAPINPTWTWTSTGVSSLCLSAAVFLPAPGTPPVAESVQTYIWGPV